MDKDKHTLVSESEGKVYSLNKSEENGDIIEFEEEREYAEDTEQNDYSSENHSELDDEV